MGRVKCRYCGSYIDDSLPNCPNCGAVNEYMLRFAKKTPRTVEELKSWYAARKLPPEEITRYFIGKDVKTPKAFGIYQDGDKFIVYKNKSDGSRAIRYAGTDEAYAVNELYMKLKEEILNQKNGNLSASRTAKTPPRSAYQKSAAKRSGARFGKKLFRFFCVLLVLGFLADLMDDPLPDRYFDGGSRDSLYYVTYQDSYEWWRYDDTSDSWFLSGENTSKNSYPEGIREDSETPYSELQTRYQVPECTSSYAYIDRHHPAADPGYYVLDDSLYYYLNNSYGTNSGWYSYTDDAWSYYCDGDDREILDDGLWYQTDEVYYTPDYEGLSSEEIYDFSEDEVWHSDFSGTDYFETYQQDMLDYEASRSNSSYDDDDDYDYSYDDDDWGWDSDSSWDWDSGSDWDSGWSDWDSDW